MKKAFTFIEVMAVMIIIGVLFVITVSSITRIMTDNKMARFKKGYAVFENTINTLIHNPSIYGTRRGFKDTSKAILYMSKKDGDETIYVSTGEVIGANPLKKFRQGFKYTANAIKDGIKCDIYPEDVSNDCFMTDDGVVFGIPDTDFDKENMKTIRDEDDDKIKVLPVTMYVDYDGSKKDPKKDAIIIGVQYDGNIRFIRKRGCKKTSKEVACQLDKYINSNTVSKAKEGVDE